MENYDKVGYPEHGSDPGDRPKVKLERVYILEQNNADGSVSFRLRWNPGGQLKHWDSLRLFRTEINPSKTRLQRWRAEAADARRAKEKDLNGEEKWKNVRHMKLDDGMLVYMNWCRLNRSPSVARRIEMLAWRLRDYWSTVGGCEFTHQVGVTEAAQFRDWLLLSVGATTVNCYLADLSGAWKWFIGESWAALNPWRAVNRATTANQAVKRGEAEALKIVGKTLPFSTAPEMWSILERLEEPRRSMVGVLATTGLRIQEAANLQDGDWDPWTHMLYVRPTHPERPDSTKRHQRSIPTPACCEMFLTVLRETHLGKQFILGGDTRLTTQLNKVLQPFGCSPHDFRRFFRTRLEGLMLPAYVIDDLLGHTTSRVRRAYVPDQNVETCRAAMEQFSEVIMAAMPAGMHVSKPMAQIMGGL